MDTLIRIVNKVQNVWFTLHKAFLVVLYVSLVIHFGFTAYLLAEPSMIAYGAYFGTRYSSVSSGNQRLDNAFRTGYILPYTIMFILMVIYAIFRGFFSPIIENCLDKCR